MKKYICIFHNKNINLKIISVYIYLICYLDILLKLMSIFERSNFYFKSDEATQTCFQND